MGNEFDSPVRKWREAIEKWYLDCESLSKAEDYVKKMVNNSDSSELDLTNQTASRTSDSHSFMDIDVASLSGDPELPEEQGFLDVVTEETSTVHLKHINDLRKQLQENSPPSYQLIGDNVDLYVKTKHMGSEKQNSSIHWFALNAVQNRVPYKHSIEDTRTGSAPSRNITEMDSAEFLPSPTNNNDILHDFIPLAARVVANKIPAFKCFSDVIVSHIPHQNSQEMKVKSTQVLTQVQYRTHYL